MASSVVYSFYQLSDSSAVSTMNITISTIGWSNGIVTCAKSFRYHVPTLNQMQRNRDQFSKYLCSNTFVPCWWVWRPAFGCTPERLSLVGECLLNGCRVQAAGREDRRMFSRTPPPQSKLLNEIKPKTAICVRCKSVICWKCIFYVNIGKKSNVCDLLECTVVGDCCAANEKLKHL